MSKIETGGPAFPMARVTVLAEDGTTNEAAALTHNGMTLRQYAAIKLCVPNSGTDWLDEMIRKSLRDRMAEKAMQGICAHPDSWGLGDEGICKRSYEMADEMLKAREAA